MFLLLPSLLAICCADCCVGWRWRRKQYLRLHWLTMTSVASHGLTEGKLLALVKKRVHFEYRFLRNSVLIFCEMKWEQHLMYPHPNSIQHIFPGLDPYITSIYPIFCPFSFKVSFFNHFVYHYQQNMSPNTGYLVSMQVCCLYTRLCDRFWTVWHTVLLDMLLRTLYIHTTASHQYLLICKLISVSFVCGTVFCHVWPTIFIISVLSNKNCSLTCM